MLLSVHDLLNKQDRGSGSDRQFRSHVLICEGGFHRLDCVGKVNSQILLQNLHERLFDDGADSQSRAMHRLSVSTDNLRQTWPFVKKKV